MESFIIQWADDKGNNGVHHAANAAERDAFIRETQAKPGVRVVHVASSRGR